MLAAEFAVLAADLGRNAHHAERVRVIASMIAELARTLDAREREAIPPHLRVPEDLPPGVARLPPRRSPH